MTHKAALRTVLAAVAALLVLGWFHARAMNWPLWHGEFCSLANGVTDGCDVSPVGAYAHIVSVLEYVIVVPLLGATFSLFTSSATSKHVRRHVEASTEAIKSHVDNHMDACKEGK